MRPLFSLGEPTAGAVHAVLLLDQFPAVLGGGERLVLRLARLLGDVGYRVSIVTFQVMCDEALLKAAGCPVYEVPVQDVVSAGGLRAAWQLGRFLRRQNVAIVMTFFESSNLFGGIATKLLSRARLIWNRRDMGILRQRKHQLAYRWLWWLPDHVIAVSEQVRRHAVEVDHVPAQRVSVVYNGVRLVEKPRHVWPEAPLVVSIGNLRRVKGQDVLVEAAATVLQHFPQARFEIAGEVLEPDYFAELQRRVAELGIGAQLRFLGGVADVGPVLDRATAFVLPSRSEGFSNAVVEAMAAGLPVVATWVGGNAEAVVEGETGLLVRAEDATGLAEAIVMLLEDAGRMRAMGEAGRVRIERLFTEEAMVGRVQEIFARVAGT